MKQKTEEPRGGDSPIGPESPWSRDDTARAKAGDRVGRFRIIEVIGSGGMGVVYKALDEALGRHVALKHPRSDVKDAETVRARFVREARAASRLLHPNVVSIFEVFEFEGVPWLAMELVEGGSLKDRLKKPEPMPLLEVLGHAQGLARALAAAHKLDILHRDIKPANVLLDSEGRARLVDFGLARRLTTKSREDEETITRLTEHGHMVGTPGYMSPEQALGRSLDARSDIFCLGLVLFEMVTGTPALRPAGTDSWLDSLLHTPATPIVHFRSDSPEVLGDIVRKALAKKPEDRYQSAEAMAADLKDLRGEVEGGLIRAKVLNSRRQRRLVQALGLAVLAAAVSAGTWWLKDIVTPVTLATTWVAKPLTHDPVWAVDPALSPDETMIAYASGRSGSGDIWLIDREGGNALQLTDHEAVDRRPAWSADGSEIYFTSFRSGEAAIWKVPRLGGTAELVLPDADDPALSPDGTQLAFVRRDDSGHYRVAIAPLDDQESYRYLTTDEDGYWYHRNPDFSPDGTMISYNTSQGLWIMPVDGGRPRRLDHNSSGSMGKSGWTGGHLIFSKRSFRTTSAVWRIDSDGGLPERLSAGAGFENQVSPSSDGQLLVYSSRKNQTWLHVVDHVTGTNVRLGDARNPDLASMAPDGSAVVYWAGFREADGLFLQHLVEGRPVGGPQSLMAQPGFYAVPVFSPDGRWVAFQQAIADQRDIWTIPVDGGVPLQFTTDEAADGNPFFSPDGTHLAFASNRSGRFHIWWARIEDGRRVGEPEQLTFGETTDYIPRISPDGSMLSWLGNRNDEENLWVRSLVGPAESRALTDGRRISSHWWEPGSRGLFACGDWEGAGLSIRRVSVVDGTPKDIGLPIDLGQGDTGGTSFSSGSISFSSDGRYSVHTQTELTGDLWILEAEPREP
ncbi:MAG: serine/threonine-protein kinase [Acidobacteria bacterium]|nr:serine/threonine-protein kinase [Acidobacteriota bacterium]